jgi:hypothetical protein
VLSRFRQQLLSQQRLPGCSQGKGKSPMDWIREAEPILVEGPVVASYGSEWQCCSCWILLWMNAGCQVAWTLSCLPSFFLAQVTTQPLGAQWSTST